jgi:ribose transport system substrate-binding protein
LIEDPNTILRKEGVEAAVAKYPQVQIIQTIAGMESVETSTVKIQDAFAAKVKEIDGVICTGYTSTVAAAMILGEWNETPGNERVSFVGIDTDQVVLDAIRSGSIDATMSQNPYGHGYITCGLLSYLLDGWRPNPEEYFVNSGTVLVTKDKVDTFQEDIMKTTEQIMGELESKYLLPPN